VRIVEFTSLQRVRQLLYIQKAFGAPLVEFLKYFFRSESADLYDVLFIWADIFKLGMQFPHNFIVKGYVPLFGLRSASSNGTRRITYTIGTWSPSSWFATTGKNQGPTTASKYTS